MQTRKHQNTIFSPLLSPLSQTYYSEMLKKRQKTRSPPKGRNSRRKTQAKKERAKHLNPFQSIYVFKTESLCKQFNLLVRDIRPNPHPPKKIGKKGPRGGFPTRHIFVQGQS